VTRRAAVYARISQDRTGAGLGVERQEQDCRALAATLGWDVVAVHTDNDVSAYSGKPRPGYRRLLAALRDGDADAVLVWHPDRLHRSPVELETYIGVVDPRGIPTATVRAGELDLSTASGRMTARIVGSVARAESERASEKLRRQREQARERGHPHGGRRPFGFDVGGMTVRAGEAELLVDATRAILDGASIRSVCRAWNAAGVTTTAGGRWDGSNLRAVLMRPRNAALMTHRGHVTGPAAWPVVVERDTWEALVALLTDWGRLTHRGTSLTLVGSFLYRCACGELVRSGGQRADGQPRYACAANHMSRVAPPVDRLVLDAVARLLVRDGLTLLTPAVDLAPLRRRLGVLRGRAQLLAQEFGDPDSGMTPAQFRSANGAVQPRIREAEAELARHAAGSPLSGVADAPDPEAALRELDVDRQRAVVGALVEVTLLPQRSGRRPGGAYFDPASVRIEPLRRQG
jgi:site-specific DNA recombinase